MNNKVSPALERSRAKKTEKFFRKLARQELKKRGLPVTEEYIQRAAIELVEARMNGIKLKPIKQKSKVQTFLDKINNIFRTKKVEPKKPEAVRPPVL